MSCCSLSLICLISADTVPVECRVGAHERRLLAIRCCWIWYASYELGGTFDTRFDCPFKVYRQDQQRLRQRYAGTRLTSERFMTDFLHLDSFLPKFPPWSLRIVLSCLIAMGA